MFKVILSEKIYEKQIVNCVCFSEYAPAYHVSIIKILLQYATNVMAGCHTKFLARSAHAATDYMSTAHSSMR